MFLTHPEGRCQGSLLKGRQLIIVLQWKKVEVAQSCLTLCYPMDYTVHGILQARILEWVASGKLPFSGGSSQPRNQIRVPCIAGRFFTNWAKYWVLKAGTEEGEDKALQKHRCETQLTVCSSSYVSCQNISFRQRAASDDAGEINQTREPGTSWLP